MHGAQPSLCQLHSLQTTYICLSEACVNNRLCCEKCAKNKHFRHDIFCINKITKPLANLNCNSDTQNSQASMAKLNHDYNALVQEFKRIPFLIFNTRKKLQDNYWSQYHSLMGTFSDFILDEAYNKMISGSANLQEIQILVAKMKFLQKHSFHSPQQIFKASSDIRQKGVQKIKQIYKKIDNLIQQLMQFFESYNFQKIDNILTSNVTQLPSLPPRQAYQEHKVNKIVSVSKQQSLSVSIIEPALSYGEIRKVRHQNNNDSVQSTNQLTIENFESDTLKKIDKLFEIYSNKQTLQAQRSESRASMSKKSSKPFVVKPVKSHKQIISTIAQQPFVKLQADESMMRKNIMYCFDEYNIQKMRLTHRVPVKKTLTKQAIIQTIQKSPKDLQQYLIIGQNQLDLECIKILSQNFPNLKKLNYCWNYEQQGLNMQYEQVFMENEYYIEKKIPSTVQLFDLYAQLPMLQNLQIDKVETFSANKVQIKNKKIKHITIGQYIGQEGEKQKQFTQHLYQQIYKLSNLVTLNIFNMSEIKGEMIKLILEKNYETLENIWISQCKNIEQDILQYLSKMKIKSLILDCSSIRYSVIMPITIQTFLMDNCECSCQEDNPVQGLKKCKDIINFSLYDCKFKKPLGNQIIKELTYSNKDIEYLNVGSCTSDQEHFKKIDNDSVGYLKDLKKLKWLNINNTDISLKFLVKELKQMEYMEKFSAIGLIRNYYNQQDYVKIIQKINKRCPKLQILLITYKNGLQKIDFETKFKKLKKLIAYEPEKADGETKKSMKQFKKLLTKHKIKYTY